jgi:hypothetical protein
VAFEFSLSDAELDALRTEPKQKLSGSRLKAKGPFFEQQFDLAAVGDSDRRFRLYRRHHPTNSEVFSVGLSVCVHDVWLTLCRYNGSYHPHRNELERNRLVGAFHIHLATHRYMTLGAHPDGFAEETARYSTVEEALRCMVLDSSISGVLVAGDADPNSRELDFTS